MQNTCKVDIIQFEKYMKPSGCCQACLSETQINKDCIITCEICRSCIHQTHYGSELLTQPPQVWQCERCRYFLENGPSDIHCEFCPCLRGIMKQYTFENRKIWLHPECAVWGYPIIFFSSSRKEGLRKEKPKSQSTYFWVRDYDAEEQTIPCQVCQGKSGYLIKCKYYSCSKSYHVTCARPQGIIRDLESMKIQPNAGYFPVYCKEHIELKIEDYKKRMRMCKEKGDIEKAAHFHKVANHFIIQLKNLEAAVKRCQIEEEMIKKMSMETRRNIHGNQNVSFSQLDESFSSQQSGKFLQILEQEMIDEALPLTSMQKIKIWKPQVVQQQPQPQKQSQPKSTPKLNRPIHHHHGRHHKHQKEPQRQISQVNARPEMQIEGRPASLPPQSSPIADNKSNSEHSIENNHKVNSYEMMFEDF